MNIWFIIVLDAVEIYLKCASLKVIYFNITDLEMAIAYWNLVLNGRFKFLDLWNKFLLVSLNLYTNWAAVFSKLGDKYV